MITVIIVCFDFCAQDVYTGSKATMMVIREPRSVFGGNVLGPINVSQIVLEQGVVTEVS